ncbi:MAG: polysaccharide deacetylase family protein [Candidatus Nealsonbacteria bacterium]
MSLRNNLKNLAYFGLNSIFGSFSVKKAAILMYHSIDYNKIFFTVSLENFKKQMNYLYKRKYNVISLTSLTDYLREKKEISAKTIVLTFDDGYEDNYFNAFPVLKKYNFPATVFLITGFIGKKKPNSANIPLQILNWSEIKEMHNSDLIDFEPHTVNHLKLTNIDLEQAEKEILESKNVIERELKKKCHFFAYPYGDYNQGLKEILIKNKFLGAVGIKERLVSNNENLFSLKRNSIDSSVSFYQFKGKLNLSVNVFRKIFKNE